MRLLYRGTRSWLNCQHWIITIAKLSIPLVFFFFSQTRSTIASQPARLEGCMRAHMGWCITLTT